MKQSLLFLSPVAPNIRGIGISIRAASHILSLAAKFDVSLIVVSCESSVEKITASISPEIHHSCKSVGVFVADSLFHNLSRRLSHSPQLRVLLEALWFTPPKWARNTPALRAAARTLSGQEFDVVHCFRLQNAAILTKLSQYDIRCGYTILDLDDFESYALKRMVQNLKMSLGMQYSLLKRIEAFKWYLIEYRFLPLFKYIWVCSDVDKALLTKRFPRGNFTTIPNVIINSEEINKIQAPIFTFLFFGALDYMPNKDAVLFFCHDVLPLIHSRSSMRFQLLIAGRCPDDSVLALDQIPEVTIVADPATVAPFYAQADVALAPIRAGGGTRIKILEAFSYGVPVIATSLGAEGLRAEPKRDILIGNTAQELADCCLELMGDREKLREIGESGRLIFEKNYSISALDQIFANFFAPTI